MNVSSASAQLANTQVAPAFLRRPSWRSPTTFEVLADIGCELSASLHTMREFVHEAREAREISEEWMSTLAAAVESANQIARDSQQIARLVEGKLRQVRERVRLDELVLRGLDGLAQRGIRVERDLARVDIMVDAALLSSLVEASLEWGASQGQHLSVLLKVKNWPEHAVLVIRSSEPDGGTADTARTDSLNWHLLNHLAQTMGVKLDRALTASDAVLSLEFPRTVRSLEGLCATEIHIGDESALTGTQSMAGQRVLLIANDLLVKAAVDEAARLLGLRVHVASTVAKARQHLQLDIPNVLVVDERLHDDEFDVLVDATRHFYPNIGLVEIADDPNTFEISSWLDNSMTRLSRDVLMAKLPCVLSLELARGM